MTNEFDPKGVAGRLKQAGLTIAQAAALADEFEEREVRMDRLEQDSHVIRADLSAAKIDLNAKMDTLKVYVEARFNIIEARLDRLETRVRQLIWLVAASMALSMALNGATLVAVLTLLNRHA